MRITRLLLVIEVWDGKPTYRKSWAGNLLVWWDFTFTFYLLQGHMRIAKLKSAYNSLIIGPRFQMVNQHIDNHTLRIYWCGRIWPWPPPSRSNDGSLALVSCLSGGYKFASVVRCVGLVITIFLVHNIVCALFFLLSLFLLDHYFYAWWICSCVYMFLFPTCSFIIFTSLDSPTSGSLFKYQADVAEML